MISAREPPLELGSRDVAAKLRLLIPRLASDAEGEVLATVAAIRRQLAAAGLDLHDLAVKLTADHRPRRTSAQGVIPAELALECLRSGLPWRRHEAEFLGNMAALRAGWSLLSPRQAKWLRDLHEAAALAGAA